MRNSQFLWPSLNPHASDQIQHGVKPQALSVAYEAGHCAVATPVPLRLDLFKQRFSCAPAMLGLMGIGCEGLPAFLQER